jgi:hypothetical protein
MRKLALAVGALAALMAASFVSPVGALAASAPHVARVLGPDSGARPPRSPVHMPSTRVPSTFTFASPVNCDDGYHFVFSPDAAGDNFLVSTASVNFNDIWAVGNQTNASGYDQTLAEHWNGTSWSVVPTSNQTAFLDDFNAVAAVSTNDVWAVGDYWSSVDASTPPNPTTVTIIAQHWDGAAWTNVAMTQPAGNYGYLFGVTAIATNNVWAVGTYYNFGIGGYQTLVEHWDGVSWLQTPSSNTNTADNELIDVSAFSSTDVWAVGEQSPALGVPPFFSLAQHWDGAAWTTLTTPNLGPGGSSNDILGVNALEAGHAVGVGFGNYIGGSSPRMGVAWDLRTGSPSAASFESGPGTGDNALLGVARGGAGVWAVGYSRPTTAINSPRQTMVFPATWNATSHTLTWSPIGVSDSPSGIDNALIGVTAISPYAFWAVGYDVSGASVAQTLTEAYCAPHFTMTGPPSAPGGSAFSLTVKVKDRDDAIRTGYLGTVHFTSTDVSATLPANYMFVSGDNGVHTFSGVVLRTGGSQTITVSDLVMPLTVPATANVTVCIGACQAPAGTAGSRNTNTGPTGTAGGRNGVNQSGSGVPGPRLPTVAQPAQSGGNASAAGPATTTRSESNVAAAAPVAASTSTSSESAPPAAAAASTTPALVPADRVVSLAAQREPVSRPPEPTPWNVLLLMPLIVSTLALLALRRRRIKEKSNARI